jgi:CSLREA domain-containing protein
MRNSFRCLISGLFLFAAIVAHDQVHAQVPVNDNWANATVIAALPFSTSEPNMGNATLEATDLDPPCRQSGDNSVDHTVWYKYTTGGAYEYVTLQIPNNHSLSAWVSVYTGTPGAFSIVSGGCTSYAFFLGVSRIAGLRLAPNTTYSIQVGSHFSGQLDFGVTSAVQYHVTKTADTNDGTCDADCSLREAISASNANPGAVIIPAGTYTLTISGATEYNNASGDLNALYGMGIYGAGMTQTVIDANHLDRAINLDTNRAGTMAFAVGDLTIRNGSVTLTRTIQYDTYGGGLAALGFGDFIGLERVAVVSSFADQVGGGIALFAPGTIRDSWIGNNASNQNGGGGLYYSKSVDRKLVVSGSTFSGNSANGPGGFGGGIYAQGALQLVNSTISGNHATHYGGGIHSESNGSLSMANSSVVFNTGFTNVSVTQTGAGVRLAGNFPSTIVNSIIAYNTAANVNDQPDCSTSGSTTLTSSYNLVQFPNNCSFAGAGDVVGVDPGVSSSLADNGGATLTHALNFGNPALNSGDPSGCKDLNGLALPFDQRGAGFPRTVSAFCDKGALESPTVTPPGAPDMAAASDSGSSSSDNNTKVQTPAFSGTCVTGNQIQLQVDAINVAPTVPCASGSYAITVSAIIADGTHAITATATSASVTSLRSVPLTVTIATVPPIISIGTHPPNPDTNPNPTFGFSSNEAGSVFQCSQNGVSYGACTSPTIISVGLGLHTFYVNATDLAGNTTAAPTTFSWNVLQAQTITFNPLPDATLAQSPVNLSATASSGQGVTFSSLTATCSVAGNSVTLLDLGQCTIRASQPGDGVVYGAAPDVDRSFTIRPLAPGVPSLDPASDSGASNSDGITNAANPVFTGACTDGDNIQLNTNLAATGSPAICSGSAYAIAVALAEGTQSISATATRSGVDSAASNGANITVDRTAPAAPSITAPIGPAAPTFMVSGTATESTGRIVVVESSTTLCTTNGPFATGNWSCQATIGSGGTHALSATQTDLAGNISAASAPFNVGIDLIFRNGFE